MDLLNEESVLSAIRRTLDNFGKIDVVVNNAGYGQVGTLEELSDREVRRNFDVNVFGVLNVIRHAMPHLRANRSGHIFNISSIGGYTASFAGWGSYRATKFAVAALTASLAAEVKSFNIIEYILSTNLSAVTEKFVAEPIKKDGGFRSNGAIGHFLHTTKNQADKRGTSDPKPAQFRREPARR